MISRASQLLRVEARGRDSRAGPPIVCDVNASDEKYCNTALHWVLFTDKRGKSVRAASTVPHAELVKELLSAGADPCLENKARKNAATPIFCSKLFTLHSVLDMYFLVPRCSDNIVYATPAGITAIEKCFSFYFDTRLILSTRIILKTLVQGSEESFWGILDVGVRFLTLVVPAVHILVLQW